MRVLELKQTIETVVDILKREEAPLFLLYGDLGAGKTYLVKKVVESLTEGQTAVSPTFTLLQVYKTPIGEIAHFDLYRLKDKEDPLEIFETLGMADFIGHVPVFIEWPQVVEDIVRKIVPETYKIEIFTKNGEERRYVFSK